MDITPIVFLLIAAFVVYCIVKKRKNKKFIPTLKIFKPPYVYDKLERVEVGDYPILHIANIIKDYENVKLEPKEHVIYTNSLLFTTTINHPTNVKFEKSIVCFIYNEKKHRFRHVTFYNYEQIDSSLEDVTNIKEPLLVTLEFKK